MFVIARVEISSQAWGWLVDATGTPQANTSATLKNLDGTNATHYSAITAGSSATTALTSNADGTLPRFVEEGPYDLTVGATTRRVDAVAGGKRPTNVGSYGATMAAINAAVAAAGANGVVELAPGVTYTLTDEIAITNDGVTVLCNGAKIRQATANKPCFNVSGDDVTFLGLLDVAYTGTKAYSATSYRGNQLYLGQSGIISSGHRLTVESLKADNLVAAVYLDNWDGASLTGYVEDNAIGRLRVTACDFGLLATGQDGLMFDRVTGSCTLTASSPNPPHLIYISDASANRNIHGGVCHARDITATSGWAYQFKGVAGGTIAGLTSDNCSGLLSIANCQDIEFGTLAGLDGVTTAGSGAVYIQDDDCERLSFNSLTLTSAVADDRLIRVDGADNVFSSVTLQAAHNTVVDTADVVFHTTASRCKVDGLRYSNRLAGGGRAIEISGANCTVRAVDILNVKYGIVVNAAATGTVLDVQDAAITLVGGGTAKVSDAGTGTKRATISGTATWDPPSIADGAATSTTVTVTGAKLGDAVTVGFTTAMPAGAMMTGSMGADGTARVVLFNKTGGALDLASGTVRVDVLPR